MKRIIVIFPIIIVAIFATIGYLSGMRRAWNESHLGFQTMQADATAKIEGSQPLLYEVNRFFKSNFFRLEVKDIIMFDDHTQVEIYAENCGWHNISRIFYSYLEDKDNGFYIKIGDTNYYSTSVNDDYKYTIKNLPINTKKLLVINFDPIPRDTKHLTILTGRSTTNRFPDRVNIGLSLGRPKYVGKDFVANWQQRELKYQKEKPLVIYPDFFYTDTSDEISISIRQVTIGYDYTYMDLTVDNYAQRTPYKLGINNVYGFLRISVPNHISSADICKLSYKGVEQEFDAGFYTIPPSTTDYNIRLIFNTIPRSTRRVMIHNLVGRDKVSELKLRDELE